LSSTASLNLYVLMSLGPFLEDYVNRRNDVKPATLVSIMAGDARDFERYLKTGARKSRDADKSADDGLSGDTVRKRIANAKQFFADGLAHGYIDKNSFADLKSTLKGNRTRDYFVTREEAQKVLDACPNSQWRLIFALALFGGLRIPSELFALKWSDIHWSDGKMTVHSPKTEHHEGKESRLAPIFPELRPYLEDARELAEPKAEYVIVRGRAKSDNLRTQLKRIIKRAGLFPWPKLFANPRSSRATDLAEVFPGHVAAAFLGHSTQTAQKHIGKSPTNTSPWQPGSAPLALQ
jgi:integrase